ncbi:GntR family transcriptional regulator [Alkalimarinus sediminis]|uniref:GntR family transcriptional regulator n=1 Tax=Alkalimarinus sediminis TaxID=1632866 RepID=A0A9E8KR53_9ALTE|nr:GntR family transcriptional regulator [Alkalimarinus sediminis]UZW75935.1 GntR family transcriptional regulator [Alkalimarinus sediminis]
MRFQAPESLSEQIAQHIGHKIITAQLKPKERIQELKVAKELDVSRGSVREALLILERRHLVNIYPRKGAVVSELSAHHINCLYDIYISLLSMLVTTFAILWKEGDLDEMMGQITKINKLTSSPEKPVDEIVDTGFTLMSMIYPIVNNSYLEETLENFKPGVSRTYYLAMKPRQEQLDKTKQFFNQLVSAVLKRDQPAIEQIVTEYGELQRSLALQELKASGFETESYSR